MTERLHWAIQKQGEVTMVRLQGPIDEDADFAALTAETKEHPHLRLDMSEIVRINSCGVREWVNFVRGLPQTSTVELENCSPVVVSQINMISNFAGNAAILSVQAPYVCDGCGNEENVALSINAGKPPTLVDVHCPRCKGLMAFDDIEESYFAFLS